VVESILSYGCEIWTVDYRLKRKAGKHKNRFLERNYKNIQNLKVRNEVIRENGRQTNNFVKSGK
jgi:hypothetical protein